MLHIVSLSEARRTAMFQMKAGVENPIAKYGISKHAAFDIFDDPLEHSAEGVRNLQTILGLLCVSLMGTAEQNITARSRCLNWHLPYFQ